MAEDLDDALHIRSGDAEAGKEYRDVTLQTLLLHELGGTQGTLTTKVGNLCKAVWKELDDLEGLVTETLDNGLGKLLADTFYLAAGKVLLNTFPGLWTNLYPRDGNKVHAVFLMLLPAALHIKQDALADIKGAASDLDLLFLSLRDGGKDAVPSVGRKEDLPLDNATDMDVILFVFHAQKGLGDDEVFKDAGLSWLTDLTVSCRLTYCSGLHL